MKDLRVIHQGAMHCLINVPKAKVLRTLLIYERINIDCLEIKLIFYTSTLYTLIGLDVYHIFKI